MENTQTLPTFEEVKKAAQDKAEVLSTNLKRKVTHIVLESLEQKGAYVTGFMYKPDLTTQCRLIDKSDGAASGINMEAAVTVINSLLIKTECDVQLTDETSPKYDAYIKGAAFYLKLYMGLAVPVFF